MLGLSTESESVTRRGAMETTQVMELDGPLCNVASRLFESLLFCCTVRNPRMETQALCGQLTSVLLSIVRKVQLTIPIQSKLFELLLGVLV